MGRRSEKGAEYSTIISHGAFGKVFKALDKRAGVYVAVKKTRLLESDADLRSESELLMKCSSPFIVRYNGAIRKENELWVKFGRRG